MAHNTATSLVIRRRARAPTLVSLDELAVIAVILVTHVVVLARVVRRLRGEERRFQLEIEALGGQAA